MGDVNAFQRKLNDLSSHKTAEVMYNRKFNLEAKRNMAEFGHDKTHGKYAKDIMGTHGEHVVVLNDERTRAHSCKTGSVNFYCNTCFVSNQHSDD